MDDLMRQAEEIVELLPRIGRQLVELSDDDPAMELTMAQMRVCNYLRGGSETMTAVAREIGISLSGATQIADRLVRAGMVERLPEADDRRVKLLRLTDHGENVIRARQERKARRAAAALERLPEDSRETVIRAFRTLLAAASESASNPVCNAPQSKLV